MGSIPIGGKSLIVQWLGHWSLTPEIPVRFWVGLFRTYSSVGRATVLYAVGRGFDPHYVHHVNQMILHAA